MRRMILCMIASGSLSAFSTSVLGPAVVARLQRKPDVSFASQTRSSHAGAPVGEDAQSPQGFVAVAGRVPPRGSLLDLLV